MNNVQDALKTTLAYKKKKNQFSDPVTFKYLTRQKAPVLFPRNVMLQAQMAGATLQAIYLAIGSFASVVFFIG